MVKKQKIESDKQLIITSALPYANGSLHLGHMVEYIQTDIYARFQRLIGRKVVYCCATDSHGTPIEVNAGKLGMTPEQLIAKFHKEDKKDFDDFFISLDSWYSTNSEENKYFSELIFKRLNQKNLIYKKRVQQLFCEQDKRFLPDRFVKGFCPNCNAEDQYGDVCEKCGKTYNPEDLKNPCCILCNRRPILKETEHYFFKLSEFKDKFVSYFKQRSFQPEIMHFLDGWLEKLEDWCISRDGPYFGFKIPGEENKFFYVWLDAPIGYISSYAHYVHNDTRKAEQDWNTSQIIHFIGKDITYFHFLFWPAMLMESEFRIPDNIYVHGFLTVNKEKMSKSRGTFITARQYLDTGAKPEFLRYYFASHLGSSISDINLDLHDFKEKINNELIANIANLAYRVISFTNKNFQGTLSTLGRHLNEEEIIQEFEKASVRIKNHYSNAEFKDAIKEILYLSSLGNKYFQNMQPWELLKETAEHKQADHTLANHNYLKKNKLKAQEVLTFAVNVVKNLSILIQPVLPHFSAELQKQLKLKSLQWDDLGFTLEKWSIAAGIIILQKLEVEADSLFLVKTPKQETIRTFSYSVNDDVKKLGVKFRVALLSGIKVRNKANPLETLKKKLKENITDYENRNKNILAEYNVIDKKTGVNSSKTPNSVSNLITLLKEKKLPLINTVVDAYNVVSVKTGIAMATHDIHQLNGNIQVRLSETQEGFVGLGNNPETLNKGEVVYADDKKLLGRFSKQCEQTKTILSSENLVLVCFGNSNITDKQMDTAIQEACELIVQFNGGNYTFLTEDSLKDGFAKKNSDNLGMFPLLIKVGEIKSVENHPDADKLFIEKIDVGGKILQVVSGIKDKYSSDDLFGRKVAVMCNLKPSKLRGVNSEGMLLVVEDKKGNYKLIEPKRSKVGDIIYAGTVYAGNNYTGKNKSNATKNSEGNSENLPVIDYKQFSKIKIVCEGKRLIWNDQKLKTDSEEIIVNMPDDSAVM